MNKDIRQDFIATLRGTGFDVCEWRIAARALEMTGNHDVVVAACFDQHRKRFILPANLPIILEEGC